MSSCHKAVRPLSSSLRQVSCSNTLSISFRPFSSSSTVRDAAVEAVSSKPASNYDPLTVMSTRGEKSLLRSGLVPIGSRRRRAAIRTSDNIPFEQLPYQCFQEARKILAADREEKIIEITNQRTKIQKLEQKDIAEIKGGEVMKQTRLMHLKEHLEWLKIQADVNDPMIKKRFEDGQGDMNKPIYRYLADRKWRQYQRLLVIQRINQLSLVPDVLPHFEPTADVRLAFKSRNVAPGEFVDSRVSEAPVRLNVQLFDKGERLLTVVVVDSDVPDIESDGFSARCHFMACNIPFGPADSSLPLSKLDSSKVVEPWLPPFAQKGSPYHRYSVWVIEQQPGQELAIAAIKEKSSRDSFSLRSFIDKYKLKAVGANVFRGIWDEGTAGVMERHNILGANVEFKKRKVIALKPKERTRGWEARHSSDKYKSLRSGRKIPTVGKYKR